MHGRVKKAVQPSPEEAAARRAQIAKYVQAKDLFLHRRHLRLVDDKTRDLTAKLIELNPDFYSLWNLRKEIALSAFKAQSATACAPTPPLPPPPSLPSASPSLSSLLCALPSLPPVWCSPETKAALCAEELAVAEKGIRRNPKWCSSHQTATLARLHCRIGVMG